MAHLAEVRFPRAANEESLESLPPSQKRHRGQSLALLLPMSTDVPLSH